MIKCEYFQISVLFISLFLYLLLVLGRRYSQQNIFQHLFRVGYKLECGDFHSGKMNLNSYVLQILTITSNETPT